MIFNIKILRNRGALLKELSRLSREIKELSDEKDALQSKILKSSDDDYLEESARQDFNLKKLGETVIAFPVAEPELDIEQEQELEDKKSFLEKVLDKFGIKRD